MAIKLNKYAIQCEKIALDNGKITSESSPTVSLHDISREWRSLCNATVYQGVDSSRWNEKEVKAANVIIATLIYLKRIRCDNIEKLLRDVITLNARQIL